MVRKPGKKKNRWYKTPFKDTIPLTAGFLFCMMKNICWIAFFFPVTATAQLQWQKVDQQFAPLPRSVHVYYTDMQLDSAPFRAYYVEADLRNKKLEFTTDTTSQRRITPLGFYQKNQQPLVVVNGTFFSFATNQNLNLVMKDGKILSYNVHTIPGRGKDTLTYRHPVASAIGISKKRKADIAWLLTDSSAGQPISRQVPWQLLKDSVYNPPVQYLANKKSADTTAASANRNQPWNMQTAIGGGPVLVQDGRIRITNNEEWRFAGKAIHDKHPRTAMGYTKDNRLIILVVEGRNPEAAGASLTQLAKIMVDLGCVEALNLDGGGSSCMLVNGKETIRPSDKVQRAVPAVFMIRKK